MKSTRKIVATALSAIRPDTSVRPAQVAYETVYLRVPKVALSQIPNIIS